MDKVIRYFYPIGQGAFYAEKHGDFNMVFDCGNLYKTNQSKKVVSQSYTKNDTIDVLFISHLDWDHISLIDTLCKTVKSIKNVIMPLLHENQKVLLTNISRTLSHSSLTLINDPEKFFREHSSDTKIIYVRPFENTNNANETNQDSDDMPSVRINEIKNTEINSGVKIELPSHRLEWVFIPYNINNKTRSADLEQKLINAGFDVEKLKGNAGYTIKHITTKEEKNKLKKIYESLDGNINENSMVVYSGPKTVKDKLNFLSYRDNFMFPYFKLHLRYPYDCYFSERRKCACIFTGDVDLNEIKIREKFAKLWDNVGTFQIPHHGSLHSHSQGITYPSPLFFPVSYGTTNTYGHPSQQVIGEIISDCGPVIHITEKADSGFIQVFKFK